MLNDNVISVKAILATEDLFGFEYFKRQIQADNVLYCMELQVKDGEKNFFIGFEGDGKGKWAEYSYMAVNVESGAVRFLDYKLPGGKRMESPPKPLSRRMTD